MMIALLSALLGFGTSVVPKFFEAFQDKRDKAHELAMLDLQAKVEVQKLDADLEKTLIQFSGNQAMSVQESYRADVQANADKNPWVNALSASVRPIVTYAFFGLYAGVKVAQYLVLIDPKLPWTVALSPAQALLALWNEEDMAIFSAVIAFWFGDRMVRKK